MPLYFNFYVLHLHVYLVHERHQIPSDKPHRLDDADAHRLFFDSITYDDYRINVLL